VIIVLNLYREKGIFLLRDGPSLNRPIICKEYAQASWEQRKAGEGNQTGVFQKKKLTEKNGRGAFSEGSAIGEKKVEDRKSTHG